MVLEKLGDAFKKAISGIANAIFLDKKKIEEIIKELQRALLEADVDVKLVFELSEKIRKQALSEKSPLEKKEHLIKLIHDELVSILGKEEYELNIGKNKPYKIMMLGLYGSGKCIYAKSNIQLSDGNIIKIEDLYNKYKTDSNKEILEYGEIIDISDKNLLVPSFNPEILKVEDKKVTRIWKLNKSDLIEIKLDNGNDFSIKVTPEHPFFVLRNGHVTKIRADEIGYSDYIAIPREIKSSGKTVDLAEEIKNLNLYVYLFPEEVKEILSSKNKSLKEIHKELKLKINYCQFTLHAKKGKIPIELLDNRSYSFLKIKEHNDKKLITIPTYLNSEFAEFLGYVMGDGYIGKNYIEISSEDIEVISRIKELSKMLFSIDAIIKRDFRTKRMYRIMINSNTLVEILKIFGLKRGKKGKELKIPEHILKSNEDAIKLFIRSYFDCDSSPSKKARSIELLSESNILIKQMNLLLRRFGILSIISKKIVNHIPYWRLFIKARYAETYTNKIGYIIKRKKRIIEDYQKIGIIQGAGNQDMIPLEKSLKELRTKLGFSIGEIQTNAVYSYGRYEEKGLISREHLLKLVRYYNFKKKGIFFEILNKLKDNQPLNLFYSNAVINGLMPFLKEQGIVMNETKGFILTKNGRLLLQTIEKEDSEWMLKNFEIIAQSDVCWIPVKEISKVYNDEKVVYDLTVEDNHSFIAEGFIVHNTTTISKLALHYNKRGFKCCALGLDVHRPAAADQLEQLGQKIKIQVFVNKKEKNPLSIIKEFEDKIKKYDLVFIDTAGRDALDNELIKEIKSISSAIQPDDIVLIMPADIGQSAKKQASEFQKACNITGVIVTRMDGTAKGGGALSACKETNAKVLFIGTGEKSADLEPFDPTAFAGRLLGMGDLKALMEKAKEAVDEKSREKLERRLHEGKFTLDDLYDQLKAMQKMGPLSKITELIPGLGKIKMPENLIEVQESKLKKWGYAIQSMTKEEKENPEILEKQTTRIQRIAKGSGINVSDIRDLLKQYKMVKKFFGSVGDITDPAKLSQKQLQKLAKQFRGKIKF